MWMGQHEVNWQKSGTKMEIYVGQWKHLVDGIKIFTHMKKVKEE